MSTIRKNICTVLTVYALAVGAPAPAYGQGKLGRVREAVRESKPQKPQKQQPKKAEKTKPSKRDHDDRKSSRDHDRQQRHRSSHRSHAHHRDRSPSFSFGSVWLSPPEPVHVVHHHVAPVESSTVILAAPQPAHESVVEPTLHAHTPTPSPPSTQATVGETYFQHSPDFDWVARLSALGGTDFADIDHGSLGLLIQPRGGLGIDTSVTMLRESSINVRDHLYLGDVNLTYEPVLASDRFRMRIGAGVNWLSDAYGSDVGFNMTGGLDWKLSARWLMTGEVDFGTIGDTDLTHAQVSLGRALSQQTELTFGYNYHDIGGVTIGSAFTGLRFRF